MVRKLGFRDALRLQVFMFQWLLLHEAHDREPTRREFAVEFDYSEPTVSRRLAMFRECFGELGWDTPSAFVGLVHEYREQRASAFLPSSFAEMEIGAA